MLATFLHTIADPRAMAFLVVGLSGSLLIAVWPSLKKFVSNPSEYLRALLPGPRTAANEPKAAARPARGATVWPRSAVAIGVLGVALAAWTGYAFTQPTSSARTAQGTQYNNVASFAFTGHGPKSDALPDGAVGPVSADSIARTGAAPVLYSNVLSSLDFAFHYQMQSKQPLQVLGNGGVALRIKAQDGWERTITLSPPQPLVGPDVTLWFSLHLDAARLLIAAVENETGSHSDWYDFTVVPVVRMAGQQGTRHFDDTFAPTYHLRYDRVHITPDATMSQTQPKLGPVLVQSTRHLGIAGIALPFALARWFGAIGALVAVACAVLFVPSTPAPLRAETPAAKGTAPPPPAGVKAAPSPSPAVTPSAPSPPPTTMPAATTAPADAPAGPASASARSSPETTRAAIARNLATSAEMSALLADSVKPSSNGADHHGTAQSNHRDAAPTGESSAA